MADSQHSPPLDDTRSRAERHTRPHSSQRNSAQRSRHSPPTSHSHMLCRAVLCCVAVAEQHEQSVRDDQKEGQEPAKLFIVRATLHRPAPSRAPLICLLELGPHFAAASLRLSECCRVRYRAM